MSKRADRRRRDRAGRTSLEAGGEARSRVPALEDAGAVNVRLARLLDAPYLERVVPRLAPEVLHHLIQHRGLDACGALVAAATPRQVASILDLDLWRATPERDDQFDERRFGSWIEMLMDEGEAVAVRVVAAMDRGLTVAGLSRHLRVFDPGVLPSAASADDGLEIAPSGHLECEVGGYVVRARTPQSWDAIVGLLVALAAEHSECFHELMQGCRRLSNSTPEPDGLDELMLEPEQLVYDVSLERESRRTRQGYLTAGDARSFLQMARQTPQPSGSSSINTIAASYFRALEGAMESAGQSTRPDDSSGSSTDPDVLASIDAVAELLTETAGASTRPRALLGPVPADVPRVTPIEPLMEYVHDKNQTAYFARNQELAFLANALVAGCSVDGRSFTVQESWNAAVGICNLGLELWSERSPRTSGGGAEQISKTMGLPETTLADHDLITAFEAGWRLLHEDVSMFVAKRVIAALADVRSLDPGTERDLHVLRRDLERHRDAGAPWRARSALDVIAILDMPAWACLRGLLSECPVVPAALTAILDGHAASVSATAFECFATNAQIRKVHDFAERLREILLG